MKDFAAHLIAFFLGAAAMAAIFLSSDSPPPTENSAKQQNKGPSQPVAPAGVANPNQSKRNNGPQTGPPPHQAKK